MPAYADAVSLELHSEVAKLPWLTKTYAQGHSQNVRAVVRLLEIGEFLSELLFTANFLAAEEYTPDSTLLEMERCSKVGVVSIPTRRRAPGYPLSPAWKPATTFRWQSPQRDLFVRLYRYGWKWLPVPEGKANFRAANRPATGEITV